MFIRVIDLNHWADSRDSEGKLPLLINKLINGTTDNLEFIYLPVEDRVSMHGPDGVTVNNKKTQFVPDGVTLWEFGTDQDPLSKINRDYNNRTKKPPAGIDKKETTFIGVVPRSCSYEKLVEWHKEKNQENEWKQVRLYDAHTLEKWIESAPEVEKWLANKLNIPINGVHRLDEWWNKWRIAGKYKIQPSLILTDKNYESEILLNHLENDKDINVKASNIEEAIAFLYSVISTIKDKKFLDKCLIIEDKQTFDYYLNREDLILIPTFDYKEYNDSNNIIYKPLLDSDPSEAEIELKDPQKISFTESLENINISYSEAKRYSEESGGNVTIFKRLLNKDITNPEWLNDEYMNVLITIFFLESWNENSDDKIIIEELSRMDFEDFTEKCEQLLHKPDTPLVKVASKWFLKSPKDLLFFISKYVSDRHLKRFEKVVFKLFSEGETDDEVISPNLKKGILKSMVLISMYEKYFMSCSIDLKIFLENILIKLNEDLDYFWNDCNQYLKYFAEASPLTFINLLKKLLENKPEIIDSLFQSSYYSIRYVDLIWALDCIPYDFIYFEDLVEIFVLLSHFSYKENQVPSPTSSLKKLFVNFNLKSNISFEYRLKTLETILDNDFEIGWKILKLLFSQNGPLYNFKYKYHGWDTLNSDLKSEMIDYITNLEQLLLKYSSTDSQKWCLILDYYDKSSDEFKKTSLIKLNSIKDDLDNKYVVWNKLRDVIGKYHDFSKNDDYKDEIKDLNKLYDDLNPHDLIEKIRWAFDSDFPNTLTGKYKDRGANLEKQRSQFINELYEVNGFNGIENLVNVVKEPYLIAFYCLDYDIDDEALNLLGVNEACSSFSKQYIFLKAKSDESFIEKIILKVDNDDFDIIKLILTALPATRKVWDLVENYPRDIQDFYWINIPHWYFGGNILDLKFFIEKLLEYNKCPEIILTLNDNKELLEVNYIGDILSKISPNLESFLDFDDSIVELLNFLYKNNFNKELLIKLELGLALCFKEIELVEPLCIHEEFIKNPNFFCDIVKKRSKKRIGFYFPYVFVFTSWKIIPGCDENNLIDKDYLDSWIKKCEELLEGDDLKYMYHKIGYLLGIFEKNKDNIPCEEVCEIIEKYRNKTINLGFKRGFDSKKVYKSGYSVDGKCERLIAEDYQNFCNENYEKYPIISKLLYSLAEQEQIRANQKDIDSQLQNWEY